MMKEQHICPVSAITQILGTRWTLQIIHNLRQQRRYCELRESVGNVNPRTFTKRLRMLVEAGIIERIEDPEQPQHVEYRLTPRGRELLPIIDNLAAWAEKWILRKPAQREAGEHV